MKIDLACGQDKQEGFLGVDIAPGPGVDIVLDLEQFPWKPFQNDSVDTVRCIHYVEHTPDLVGFMNELWRICKHGASIRIQAPFYTSKGAWQDPTHKRAITDTTFNYFNKSWRTRKGLHHYSITADFSVSEPFFYFNDYWKGQSPETQSFALAHYWNVSSDIAFDLTAIKNR